MATREAVALLARHYAGAKLTDTSTAAYLVTVDRAGWPHAAMISMGELVVRDDSGVALALWNGTRTTGHLVRTGRATLLVVLGEHAVRSRLNVRRVALADPPHQAIPLAYFVGSIEEAAAERAPYAQLASGITFSLADPGSVVPRWEATRTLLNSLLG